MYAGSYVCGIRINSPYLLSVKAPKVDVSMGDLAHREKPHHQQKLGNTGLAEGQSAFRMPSKYSDNKSSVMEIASFDSIGYFLF